MIGVLFATSKEAAPFLARLEHSARGTQNASGAAHFMLPECELSVLITGIGKDLARLGAVQFIERFSPSRIINVGIAGALLDTLCEGGVYRVSSAVDWPDREHRPIPCAATGVEDLPSVRLVTSDTPVFDDETRRVLQKAGDAVDMEGAVIADVCHSSGVECVEIKCISDFARNGEREQLLKNLDKSSRRAATVLAERLAMLG